MAAPEQFFDPFFQSSLTSPDFSNGPGDVSGQPLELPVAGQGTIAVRSTAKNLLQFNLATRTLGSPTLHLDIGTKEFKLYYVTTTDQLIDMTEFVTIVKSTAECWLNLSTAPMPDRPENEITYWLSVDKNNGYIRYGKGFTNKSMMLFELSLKHATKDNVMIWNNPTRDGWLEDLKNVHALADKRGLEVSGSYLQKRNAVKSASIMRVALTFPL
jgi:hypothetical protein